MSSHPFKAEGQVDASALAGGVARVLIKDRYTTCAKLTIESVESDSQHIHWRVEQRKLARPTTSTVDGNKWTLDVGTEWSARDGPLATVTSYANWLLSWGAGSQPDTQVTIQVPAAAMRKANAALDVRAVNTGVELGGAVEHAWRAARVDTSNSRITVSAPALRTQDDAVLSTSNARVSGTQVDARCGAVRIDTSNASVVLERLAAGGAHGDGIVVDTSNGAVRVAKLEMPANASTRIGTSNGAVDLGLFPPRGAFVSALFRCGIHTSNGDVAVHVHRGSAEGGDKGGAPVHWSAKTSNGFVRAFGGEVHGAAEGVLGGEAAAEGREITIKTSNAHVVLEERV